MDYKARIISTLKELASTRGFYGVTVDELAARTGISKRTMYRYFKSKEEMIALVMEEFISETGRKVKLVLSSSRDPVEQVTNLIRTISEQIKVLHAPALYDLQKHYPHVWEKVERFREERIQEIFKELFSNDTEGRFRKINPKIFTTALIASVRAMVNPAFIMENNLSPEETIQSIFTIFLHGVVNRPGA
ncbi:MAG: TetR/AcrR family transcriptional regulator [Firmicutes bacterium]|nr:TetR/AcrR family transcriptional regulator [Bacillota bacterium]